MPYKLRPRQERGKIFMVYESKLYYHKVMMILALLN